VICSYSWEPRWSYRNLGKGGEWEGNGRQALGAGVVWGLGWGSVGRAGELGAGRRKRAQEVAAAAGCRAVVARGKQAVAGEGRYCKFEMQRGGSNSFLVSSGHNTRVGGSC